MKFKIVEAWTAAELQGAINTYLEAGWELHGQLIVYQGIYTSVRGAGQSREPRFCQAIILKGNKGNAKNSK